jgi:hypothetical protein
VTKGQWKERERVISEEGEWERWERGRKRGRYKEEERNQ